MENQTQIPRPYFHALDGLRLLASLNIVLTHLNSSWCLGDAGSWPIFGILIRGPAFNASLFFVLGGFIFFFQIASRLDKFRLSAFLRSRFFRLYPLHLVSLLLMVLVVAKRHEFYGDFSLFTQSILAHLSLVWAFDPTRWLPLNEPSWALTPFFLAYFTIGPVTRALLQERRTLILFLFLVVTLLPTLFFAGVYSQVSTVPFAYKRFHVFPILRIGEFYFGMALARIFQKRKQGPCTTPTWFWDFGFLMGIAALWGAIRLKWGFGPVLSWLSPHLFVLVIYGWLIWLLAFNRGLVAKLFSSRIVSSVGQASFYPYLLHLPLISVAVIIAQALGFQGFFKIGWQPVAFLVILYGCSTGYSMNKKRRSKKKRHSSLETSTNSNA
ncbi:MAG TPA: acyltransferase family protein [Fibrobacteraceae bacterium]|nr:acyltransferase family protein [Fibrobacteraceae bacterium]